MKTLYRIEDILAITEIVNLSENMINSIGTGNFYNTPVIYEELFLTVAKLMNGDLKN